jgi:hypothetical protein
MKHTPAVTTAADGVTLVPVSNRPGVLAVLDTEDWEGWLASGRPTVWFLAANSGGRYYLRYRLRHGRGRLGTVARDLAAARPDEIVRPADGNPLNLRRSNLIVEPARAVRGQSRVEPALAGANA